MTTHTRPRLALPFAALVSAAVLAGCTAADGSSAVESPEPRAAEPTATAPADEPADEPDAADAAPDAPEVRGDAARGGTDPWSDPDAVTGAECLVGTWEFDLGTYVAAELATNPSRLRTSGEGAGASRWTFGADGSMTTSVDGFSLQFTDDVVSMTVAGSGARVGTWSLVEGRLSTTTDRAASTLVISATAEAGGRQVDASEEVRAVVDGLGLTGSPVACLDDTLHLRTVDGDHRVLTRP